jgi:hypothetical protein
MKKQAQQLGFLEQTVPAPATRAPATRPPCEVCGKELVRGEDCWVCPSGHVIDWDDDADDR